MAPSERRSGAAAPPADEREKSRDQVAGDRVDDVSSPEFRARRQALADPGAFMHCLPVRRNVVVTDEVIDGPHSWVAEQARSRVLTQAAVLHEIVA